MVTCESMSTSVPILNTHVAAWYVRMFFITSLLYGDSQIPGGRWSASLAEMVSVQSSLNQYTKAKVVNNRGDD